MRFGEVEFDEDARSQTNGLILGSIGFGKSKCLEHIARQDLRQNQHFMLIDFHSPVYQNTVEWCVYNDYKDVVLLDLSSGRFAKGYNRFRRQPGVDMSVQVGGMVDAVMSVWGDPNPNNRAVIFKLLVVLFTVMLEFRLQLLEGFELLADRKQLSYYGERLSDPAVKALWSSLKNTSPNEWERQVAPTIGRLFRIVRSETVRRFMGVSDENSLSLTFDQTILINLASSDHLDADGASIIAALLINDLYQSAKRRPRIDRKDPTPYFLYCDEWWLVPTPDWQRILRETRKAGLVTLLANQDLEQLNDAFSRSFAQSLLTMCQLQVCFGGINDNDASRLAREWDLPVHELKSLMERELYVKLPRQSAQLTVMPEIKTPFLEEGELEAFEAAHGLMSIGAPSPVLQNEDTPTQIKGRATWKAKPTTS
jgi:hypothetical protein